MAIADGMRTHDEGNVPRYRMPDLLTLEEMKIFFAGTYGVDIEIKPISDEMREKAAGVGVLPLTSSITDRDRELSELRNKLGIAELEKRLDSLPEGLVRELDSRTMTREEFADKYGEQPPVETPDEKEARLNPVVEDEEVQESPSPGSNPEDELKKLLG